MYCTRYSVMYSISYLLLLLLLLLLQRHRPLPPSTLMCPQQLPAPKTSTCPPDMNPSAGHITDTKSSTVIS